MCASMSWLPPMSGKSRCLIPTTLSALSTVDPDEEPKREEIAPSEQPLPLPQFPDGTPIPPELLEGLQGLQGAQLFAAFRASFWSGPTPRAEELDKYNGTMDGGANRVMELIETQAGHRQDLERKDVEADIQLRKLGLIFGFTITLIAVAGGLALIAAGDNAGLFGPILTAVAVLSGVFVWWRKNGGSGPPELPPAAPQ
jgi:uncharacterized membrane protein